MWIQNDEVKPNPTNIYAVCSKARHWMKPNSIIYLEPLEYILDDDRPRLAQNWDSFAKKTKKLHSAINGIKTKIQ